MALDDVDQKQIAQPILKSLGEISRFILVSSPCSSIFDYSTYLSLQGQCPAVSSQRLL